MAFRGQVFRQWLRLMCLIAAAWGGSMVASASPQVEGITFATEPGKLFVPMDEVSRLLQWQVRKDGKNGGMSLNQLAIPSSSLRRLVDGTALVSLSDLETAGASVARNSDDNQVLVIGRGRDFSVTPGVKRVEISLAEQKLKAWQGNRLVLESRISSGRHGGTPSGDFQAGPYKARMHYSARYDNAPMPWSVQIHGHVFIHGFTSVPHYPASHGCIRLPLNEGNPAKFFYEWIDRGTPVRVRRG